MNEGVSLKKAVVAALCEHPDASKYLARITEGNADAVVNALAQPPHLTKADFLATDDTGRPFMDSPGAWKNFEKIVKIIQANGERLTFSDFSNPMTSPSYRTLLDSAKTNNSLAKVFSFDVWKGHFDEMEQLWYKLPKPDRAKALAGTTGPTFSSSPSYGLIPLELKKRLLEAEGRTAPEERLKRAGLTPEDIRRAAVDPYTFETVTRKLQQAGDYFRKDYVLLLDSEGDTMFDGREKAWSNYPAIVQIMAAHGERLEVKDFLRQVSTTRSMLARAADMKALDKVFAPEQWVNRLPEMLVLWSNVLEGWKARPLTTADFDAAYATAEGLTYTSVFTKRDFTGKNDLLTPLNAGKPEKPVIALGLKAVWENIVSIQSFLSEQGEPLTLEDLRRPSGQKGESCLIIAAKYGYFEYAAHIARQGDEQLTLNDFKARDSHGKMLIDILAEKNQLDLVFTSDVWVGHLNDMQTLWASVNKNTPAAKHIDFKQVEIQTKQATLRQLRNKHGGFRIPPR